MPYKFNQPRRHKIPKSKYRVTNWPEYDAALLRRGSLTLWFTDEAVAAWQAESTGKRGAQRVYSALAIETALAMRLVFRQALRQTEGLLRSMANLLGLAIPIPDYTTLSRRGGGLRVLPEVMSRDEPLHILVDSTGLKICGEGEWLHQKQGIRPRRSWRKLHLALNADSKEIVASELTPDEIGDATEVAPLLDQIEGKLGSFIADGAYDGGPIYEAVAAHQPDPPAVVVIPPRSSAVPSSTATTAPTQRDLHLETITQQGRIAWQRSSGYNRRAWVETAIYRYKTIIGRRLRARCLANQQVEAKIGCNILNRMTRLGMPVFQRIA